MITVPFTQYQIDNYSTNYSTMHTLCMMRYGTICEEVRYHV